MPYVRKANKKTPAYSKRKNYNKRRNFNKTVATIAKKAVMRVAETKHVFNNYGAIPDNLYYKIKYIVKNIPIIPESYFKKMKIKYDFVMKLANIIDIILNTPMNEFENEEELKNILFHECQIL
jgi:hypothetical protein